jgi:hypothetical protein
VIRHLAEDGIEVYVIDNGSTDDTVAEVGRWIGRGVLDVESFPLDGGDGLFRWQKILDRKMAVAAEIGTDWVIHHDADEIRYSPWHNLPLRDAIAVVDRRGFNAVDFRLLNFPPVDDSFTAGTDPAAYFTLCEDGPERDRVQVKCWKWTAEGRFVDGGHDVEFPDKQLFPIRFILCHYPIRGQTHGMRKVFEQRKERFTEEERTMGWHIQYDDINSPTHCFLRNPASLRRCDLDAVRLEVQLEPVAPSLDFPEPFRAGEIPYEGVLDVAGPDEISGWARSPRQADPVSVDLWASDRFLATVRADIFRRDLRESGIGTGFHGFSLRAPDLLRHGRRCSIWANVTGTATSLKGSPLTFERRSRG